MGRREGGRWLRGRNGKRKGVKVKGREWRVV